MARKYKKRKPIVTIPILTAKQWAMVEKTLEALTRTGVRQTAKVAEKLRHKIRMAQIG